MTASTIRLDGAELTVRTYPAGDTCPASGEFSVYAGVGTVFSVSGVTPAQLHELADAFAVAARAVSTPIREAAEQAA